MPKISPEKLLNNVISKLRGERAALLLRVSEIDASFGRLGIALSTAGTSPALPHKALGKRRGRPPGSKNPSKKVSIAAKPPGKPGRKKGKRRVYAVTAAESILAFIKGAGQPNAAEVNVHWKNEGRAGKADTPISNLVKAGKLKRVIVDGERGSRYTIA